MRRICGIGMVALALGVVAGCAVRLGGPKPVEFRTLAYRVGAGAAPAEVAGWIRQAGADVVLLAAEADSAWFGEVAERASLQLSGPGESGQVALGFLAGKAVGDTTITLALPDEGGLVVHDALYEIGKKRYLDLLAVRIENPESYREAVRVLLEYVATDVMPQAAVMLAVDVPDAATGDSIASLLDPAFMDARACLEGRMDAPSTAGMRLFYGPEARMRCQEARPVAGEGSPIVARLVVGR